MKIDYGHCKHIEIGNNVTIAPQVYLLAHDASTKKTLGYTRIGKIKIEDNVFIGLRAIIMPNVKIGKNSIIGVGAIVTKNIPANSVAVGDPAKIICSVGEYYRRKEQEMLEVPNFDEEFTERKIESDIDRFKKSQIMNTKMNQGIGYIK